MIVLFNMQNILVIIKYCQNMVISGDYYGVCVCYFEQTTALILL